MPQWALPWYRYIYEVATVVCVIRAWRVDLPWWRLSLAVSLIFGAFHAPERQGWLLSAWPYLLPVPAVARALAALEAYGRAIPLEFTPHARRLSRGTQLLALAQIFGLVAFLQHAPAPPFGWSVALAVWIRIWTAHWLMMALLFLYLWPGIANVRHALILLGILLAEDVGALVHLARPAWATWHWSDVGLWYFTALLMFLWSAVVPTRPAARYAHAEPG